MEVRELKELRILIDKLIGEMISDMEEAETSSVSKVKRVKFAVPEVEKIVTEHIHDIGIPAHLKGHEYLRTAIMMVIEDPSLTRSMTKIIYPSIAEQFKDTYSRVVRAMRTAIEIAWARGNIEVLEELFGYTISAEKGKATNSEFIAIVADHIRTTHL